MPAKKTPKRAKSTGKQTPASKVIRCQGADCAGYVTKRSDPNRTRLYYAIFVSADGVDFVDHYAYLCKYCSEANRKFFKRYYKL